MMNPRAALLLASALAFAGCKGGEQAPAGDEKGAPEKAAPEKAAPKKAAEKPVEAAAAEKPAAEKAAEKPAGDEAAKPAEAVADAEKPAAGATEVKIEVGDAGYTPDAVKAKAGVPLALTFTRTSESICGETVVFPKQDIRKDLPLNTAVTVNITPKADETIAFTCGMGMFKGSIVAVQ